MNNLANLSKFKLFLWRKHSTASARKQLNPSSLNGGVSRSNSFVLYNNPYLNASSNSTYNLSNSNSSSPHQKLDYSDDYYNNNNNNQAKNSYSRSKYRSESIHERPSTSVALNNQISYSSGSRTSSLAVNHRRRRHHHHHHEDRRRNRNFLLKSSPNPITNSSSLKESRIRVTRIEDEQELMTAICELFFDQTEFLKNVCSVCLQNKCRIDPVYREKIPHNNQQQTQKIKDIFTSKIRKSLSMPFMSITDRNQNSYTSNNTTSKTSNINQFKQHNRNRCYFTLAQSYVAQAFKSIDFDFDRKLSFKEFHVGLQILLTKKINSNLNNSYTKKQDDLMKRSNTTTSAFQHHHSSNSQSKLYFFMLKTNDIMD
jgi:hypothetical protein